MNRLESNALAKAPLLPSQVLNAYESVKYCDAETRKIVASLCESHERLRKELEGAEELICDTNNEVASVLQLMDGLAQTWGDEGIFRRCRDRLRKLVGGDPNGGQK